MEAILRLRLKGQGLEPCVCQIAKSFFLAVFLCCLYLDVLGQSRTGSIPADACRESNLRFVAGEQDPGGVTDAVSKSFSTILPMRVKRPAGGETAIPEIPVVSRVHPVKESFDQMTAGAEMRGVAERDTAFSDVVPEVSVPGTEDSGTEEPAQLRVILHGNGGVISAEELLFDSGSFDIESIEKPARLGKVFDGWYRDAACTVPYSAIEPDVSSVELYAGWSEFAGFVSDDNGFITGYTDGPHLTDEGVLALPTDINCLGVAESAFAGLEEAVTEIYIPANITDIAESELTRFPYLMYIYAEEGNPYYYSEFGALYYANGTLAAQPAGWNQS